MLGPHRLELGEGPGYDPVTDLAWWFDIPAKRLFMRLIAAGETVVHDLPLAASAMAVTAQGRQLLLAEDGLYFRNPASGALDLHVALEADNPTLRSNDARVHPSGAFWISTMGWQAEEGAGSIYRYFRGKVEKLWDGITIPNAICFAPDGRTAYFTDTPTRRIQSVETDPTNGRVLAAPQDFITGLHWPDGAVTDAAGNLWVAMFGTGQVLGFAPDGRAIGEFQLPAANLTCPAFVGRDARQMLVTSAFHDMDHAARKQAPDAGATFILPLDFAGRFDPPVDIGR
ncbi:SMP-30/gluconolactonase/LRE family protein [Pseudorhodobacter sp.]|uniref:SMP-30/gluconolactonase/LRE family protein n=1 Tax=Pseudorhodobacter sp. TaxID=1934400 RepID=UPI002647F4B0|nr:SMP-30/gluconolactonase/LRE family protein [Pseudorhodobacter sp.]MDN5788021.1 SMP-30/gluconolactonase/LRE family protein [Pseudorhodobacter sp.]